MTMDFHSDDKNMYDSKAPNFTRTSFDLQELNRFRCTKREKPVFLAKPVDLLCSNFHESPYADDMRNLV